MLKFIKDNKGNITITRVICYFFFVLILAFSSEVVILMTQHVVTSYQAAYYAEKIAIQGGILGNTNRLPGPINSTKDCTTCLSNAQLSEKITKDFRHFGLTKSDWESNLYDADNNKISIHKDGTASSKKHSLKYMDIGYFELSTYFVPKVSGFLWAEKRYIITKKVPIVSEYIPK